MVLKLYAICEYTYFIVSAYTSYYTFSAGTSVISLKTDRTNPINAEMQLINLENLCDAAETGCLQVGQYFPQINAVLFYLSGFGPALCYQKLDNNLDHTRGKAHYSGKIALFYLAVIMVDVTVYFYFLFYYLFVVHLFNNITQLRFFINI